MRTVDERTADLASTLREIKDAIGADIRVAMPGTVEKWDEDTQTVSVKLCVREKIINAGAETDADIPILVDVPIVMPRAGDYMVAMVPKKGDEVLVHFADLCIDAWWQSGGIQNQDEIRRHDFSDGFAVFGTWSQKRKPALPQSGIRIQKDNASTYVHVSDGRIELKAQNIQLNAGSVTVNGRQIVTE